jgi:hypothetical protein
VWVEPLYGKKLNVIFDKKQPISKQQFAYTYDICNKGPLPKGFKLGRNFEKENVKKKIGSYINKNGYNTRRKTCIFDCSLRLNFSRKRHFATKILLIV